MIWHSCDIEDVKRELGVDPKVGLGSAEIVERIHIYGENKIVKQNKKSLFARAKKRFSSPYTLLLLIFATILLVTGIITKNTTWYSPILLPVILVANAFLTAFLEIKSEKSLEDLKEEVTLSAKVMRDGEIKTVPINTLVPGDIVYLEEGDFIPADGRLLESSSLICDDSALTDDTDPGEKQSDYIPEDICPLTGRKNMVFYGCSVTFGSGIMVVTETGMETELARKNLISHQVEGQDTPLTQKIKEITRPVGYGIVAVSIIIFILGVLFGSSQYKYFSDNIFSTTVLAAAFGISVLPEGLLGIATAAYGFGIRKMYGKRVVIENTPAAEKLREISVILSDKTGTLTKNRMSAVMLFDGNRLLNLKEEEPDQNFKTLISTAALCCNSDVTLTAGGKKRYSGDPTEGAIVESCLDFLGITKTELENISPRMGEVPFDSERKLMTTVNMINNRPFAVVKGSADILTELSTGGNVKGCLEAAEEMSNMGLRVIAVGIKPLDEVPSNPTSEELECELSILGLIGIEDVITEETKEMIKTCNGAGIKTVMITGDYITSAVVTAKKMGLIKDGDLAITGEELAKLSEEEFKEKIYNISVYSRITADDKMRIVTTFQSLGEKIAVTGDSALDAHILRQADVGCAMGATGTDISKGAADLVLNEDSYISIGESIKHSRGIYKNIKRGVGFLLTTLLAEALIMIFGFLFFATPPISAAALLWINLIILLLPLIALISEPAGDYLMKEPPETAKKGLFSENTGINILWQGILAATVTLIAGGIGEKSGTLQGMIFATLCLSALFLSYALRGEVSLLKVGFLTNINMLVAMALSVVLLILVLLTPISSLLSIPFAGGNFALVILLSLIPFGVCEIIKIIKYFLLRG